MFCSEFADEEAESDMVLTCWGITTSKWQTQDLDLSLSHDNALPFSSYHSVPVP